MLYRCFPNIPRRKHQDHHACAEGGTYHEVVEITATEEALASELASQWATSRRSITLW
jgi:hypothetical protein